MKKLLLSTAACLTLAISVSAQNKVPCGTYQAREIYLKTIPGYAQKLNDAKAASDAEYNAFLQKAKLAKTSTSVQPTYTVPVVFHILHDGDATGTGSNISDQLCIDALTQVNKDFAKQGADTVYIDNVFKPLYENSNMQFMLAKKDPQGNCTNGIVHHYDENTVWDQSTAFFNYVYSTTGNWEPSKYLNIYVVDNIISGSSVVGGGIIVGYTHLPGTSPSNAADAIVYRNDFLGLGERSLSHEIGHWFGLAHTFGDTNDPGFECGDDGILDTPPTTGFFSTCPAAINYTAPQTVLNPTDSSDIINVRFGAVMSSTTALNSLNGFMKVPALALTATSVTATSYTYNTVGTGSSIAGGYSDFSQVYPNDFNAGSVNTISVTSVAQSTVNNYVGVFMDYNQNGIFSDAGEVLLNSSASLFGTQSFSASVTLPTNLYGIYRMRVITSNTPITGPTMSLTNGEIEDYNFSIGTTPSPTTGVNKTMAACSETRPNVENIMDYSSCPLMFTKGQTDKMRISAASPIASRSTLTSEANLYEVGLLTTKSVVTLTTTPTGTVAPTTYTAYAYSNPSTVTACAPVADFAQNNSISCANQTVKYTSTSYYGTPTSYSWVFEGGTPSTSTLAVQTVTYSTPGNYSTSLTVSNAEGTTSKSVSSAVSVKWNSDLILPYTENFESGTWWPTGMVVENFDLNSPSWVLSNYGSQNSTKCLVLPNANFVNGFFGEQIDVIETPRFDFSTTSNISLSFDYSFARKTGVTDDEFELQYSIDCGANWTKVLSSPTASVMSSSGGVVNAPYVPVSSTTPNPKWITKTFPTNVLSTLGGKRDVKFRFWFKNESSGQSQNLYIDNINISGTVGLPEFNNSFGMSIYPNPTSSSSLVEFATSKDVKASIIVYDLTGRIVEEGSVNAAAGNTSKYNFNAQNKLNSGVYFVTLVIDNNKVTKKLIVN